MGIDELQLEDAVSRIVADVHPRQVILFGSFARGCAGANSDVDLLVLVDDESPALLDRVKAIGQLHRKLSGIGFAKDILLFSVAEFELRKNLSSDVLGDAARDGLVLYDAA